MDGSIPTPDAPPPCPRLPVEPVPSGGPFERIEAEITELWGHISAATYRFLKLLAEYDQQQCWGYHGCRDCAPG